MLEFLIVLLVVLVGFIAIAGLIAHFVERAKHMEHEYFEGKPKEPQA